MVNPASSRGCRTTILPLHYTEPRRFNYDKAYRNQRSFVQRRSLCASVCPTSAIIAQHTTNEQVLAEIEGLMEF